LAKKLALNSKVGVLGEEIAIKFLMKRGFSIIFQNYLKKWGEIDIVAKKGEKLHFIEVKSVSCEMLSHEAQDINPADNIHSGKLRRFGRVVQSYLLENKVSGNWQADVLLVYLNVETKEAKVEVLPNIAI